MSFKNLLMTMTVGAVMAAAMSAMTPAMAQEAGDDFRERMALAEKMSAINPPRTQVEAAIANAAERMPADSREEFINSMMGAIDISALEKESIEAYAQIFTKAELAKMVEFYSSEEARSASAKMPRYAERMGPQVIRMLDKAAMQVRTGGAGADPVQ